jgi:competence protein ComEA
MLLRMHRNRLLASAPLLVVASAVVAATAVVASFLLAARQNDGDVIILSNPASVEIAVEVRGEVANPGVYRLPEDARLIDLLEAAGGATQAADLAAHNLARRIDDAEIVTILPVSAASPVAIVATVEIDDGNSLAYRVNINSASRAELEALPGIGPVIAQRIIDYRVAHGPFRSAADLAEVEGVSESLLADIENLITIGP